MLADFKVRYATEPLDKVAVQTIGPQVWFKTCCLTNAIFSIKMVKCYFYRLSYFPSPCWTSSRTTSNTFSTQAT
jgi:hypothetical protein